MHAKLQRCCTGVEDDSQLPSYQAAASTLPRDDAEIPLSVTEMNCGKAMGPDVAVHPTASIGRHDFFVTGAHTLNNLHVHRLCTPSENGILGNGSMCFLTRSGHFR